MALNPVDSFSVIETQWELRASLGAFFVGDGNWLNWHPVRLSLEKFWSSIVGEVNNDILWLGFKKV